MFNLQGSEIIVILLLALVVLGPEKLPDAIRRFSRTYAELKKMGSGFQSELKSALDEPMREMRETSDLIRKAADPATFTEPDHAGASDPDPDVDHTADPDPDVDGADVDRAWFADRDPDVDGADVDAADVDGVVDEFPDPGSTTVAVPRDPADTGPPDVVETTRPAADHDEVPHNGAAPGRPPDLSGAIVPSEGSRQPDAVSGGPAPRSAADLDDESATA